MIFVQLFFLLFFIVSLIFRILYVWDFAMIMLVISIVVPISSIAIVLILKYTLNTKIAIKEGTCNKNQPFNIQIQIKNKTIFPVSRAEAIIEYENEFDGKANIVEIFFPIQSLNTQQVTFQLSSKFSGKIKVKSAFIIIYDPLQIFKAKVAKNIGAEIVVMPTPREVHCDINDGDFIDDESELFSQIKAGDDVSEIFDLHEYNAGDKISRIHWKLSSKMSDFIVKDYSLPINTNSILFLDLTCNEKSEYTLPIMDTLLETFISLSELLLMNEKQYKVIFYNQQIKDFETIYINSIETLYIELSKIIAIYDSSKSYFDLKELQTFINEFIGSSLTYITSNADNKLCEMFSEINCDSVNIINIVKTITEDKSHINYANTNFMEVVIGNVASSIFEIQL